jgi:hypothetical protein
MDIRTRGNTVEKFSFINPSILIYDGDVKLQNK